jgi:hypothetical protein
MGDYDAFIVVIVFVRREGEEAFRGGTADCDVGGVGIEGEVGRKGRWIFVTEGFVQV